MVQLALNVFETLKITLATAPRVIVMTTLTKTQVQVHSTISVLQLSPKVL
jgi:hypothetical protein